MNLPTKSYEDFEQGLAIAKQIAARVPQLTLDSTLHELKVRSLILLTHSTVEDYLEQLSRELAEASVKKFNNSGTINAPLFSLVSFHKSSFAETFKYPSSAVMIRDAFSKAADEAFNKHLKVIEENHGIKANHHNKLLFPVGLMLNEIDVAIPPLLDSFAAKRNGVAHSVRIKTKYTRSAIETDITNMKKLLKELDKAACKAYHDDIHTV